MADDLTATTDRRLQPPMPLADTLAQQPGQALPPLVQEGLESTRRAIDNQLVASRELTGARMAAMRDKSASLSPILEQIATQTREPPPAPPARPTLPPAPTRTFQPFMEGMPGENPWTSLQRGLAALGQVAIQAKGAFGGAPRSALASLNGALVGWAQGDKERGDALFEDWRAKTAEAVTNWQMARQEFGDVLQARHATLQGLQTQLQAVALRHDMPMEMLDLLQKDQDKAFELFNDWGGKLAEAGWRANEAGLKFDQKNAIEKWKKIEFDALEAERRRTEENRVRDDARRVMEFETQQKLERDRLDEQRRYHDLLIAEQRLNREARGDKVAAGKPLPAAAMQGLSSAQDLVRGLDLVFENFEPGFVGIGPGSTKWLREKGLLGKMTPKEALFHQNVDSFFNQLANIRGGKVLPANEQARIEAEAPHKLLDPGVFLQRLGGVRKALVENLPRATSNLQQGGYNVPEDLLAGPTKIPSRAQVEQAKRLTKTPQEASALLKSLGFDTAADGVK